MKISFSQLGNHGRLANQLFQVASTLGIAERHKAAAVFPEWKYEAFFDLKIEHGMGAGFVLEEPHFHHYDFKLKQDCDLHGYFQSEKYFGSQRLKFKESFLNEQRAKLPEGETICFHIRRGDFVGNVNYYQLPITYYIDSLLTYFPDWKRYKILIISDDIEYCKVHFECLPNVTFGSGTDIEDMALASLCDHFIIPNSSYGWWCAWLGEKPHSKIIHPGHLFIGKLSVNDTKDFWPERWTRNQKETYKIPLLDVTFTIPVYFDHTDRKKNADLSLCILMTNFDTHFIVCEQGAERFKYMEAWATYVKFDSKEFHRTKMLNDMARMAKTDIIVNWDCDVIVPPMQIYTAVDAIRKGADMVFPYGGPFARMPREVWFSPIEQRLDIGIVRNTHFKGRARDHNSVGGAVLFYKDSFIDGGMENENMISFGPEDCERNDRFKALGYDVRQIPGSLFHMDHYCGPTSSPMNKHFRANHVELEKVRSMLLDREQLRAYVDSWPWVSKKVTPLKSEYRKWLKSATA